MALVTLEEAKTYLRVDSSEEDAVVGILLTSAGKLCADVARLTEEQWAAVDADETENTGAYTKEELSRIREVMKVAVLYALAYLYEHREEADHHSLVLTLRSLLFSIREEIL